MMINEVNNNQQYLLLESSFLPASEASNLEVFKYSLFDGGFSRHNIVETV